MDGARTPRIVIREDNPADVLKPRSLDVKGMLEAGQRAGAAG